MLWWYGIITFIAYTSTTALLWYKRRLHGKKTGRYVAVFVLNVFTFIIVLIYTCGLPNYVMDVIYSYDYVYVLDEHKHYCGSRNVTVAIQTGNSTTAPITVEQYNIHIQTALAGVVMGAICVFNVYLVILFIVSNCSKCMHCVRSYTNTDDATIRRKRPPGTPPMDTERADRMEQKKRAQTHVKAGLHICLGHSKLARAVRVTMLVVIAGMLFYLACFYWPSSMWTPESSSAMAVRAFMYLNFAGYVCCIYAELRSLIKKCHQFNDYDAQVKSILHGDGDVPGDGAEELDAVIKRTSDLAVPNDKKKKKKKKKRKKHMVSRSVMTRPRMMVTASQNHNQYIPQSHMSYSQYPPTDPRYHYHNVPIGDSMSEPVPRYFAEKRSSDGTQETESTDSSDGI